MNKWQKYKIEDVCDFIGGSQPPKSTFLNYKKENYVRLVQTRDFKTDKFPTYIPVNSTTKFFGKEDIIIGRYGPPIFQIFRGILDGAYNVALMKAVPKKNITNDFLYYFLTQKKLFEYVDKLSARTGGQTGVDLISLNKYPINLPDKTDQQKIASVLSVLDSKIVLNNKINIELDAMVKTLYDYWFVQFDFPDKNGKPYKSSGGKMVWSEELKREIPEGWKINNLFQNSLTTILKPKIEKFEGKKEYLATANINDRELTRGDKITYENRESRANMQPIKNSVWFAKMKASKKHLFLGEYSDDIIERNILSTGFMGLKCEEYAFEYLASYISSDIFEITKNEISHGATMQGIGNDDLKFINLLIPEKEIVINYKKKVEDIYKKMDLIRRENFKLVELRDWLLPMLMNGQIAVK